MVYLYWEEALDTSSLQLGDGLFVQGKVSKVARCICLISI